MSRSIVLALTAWLAASANAAAQVVTTNPQGSGPILAFP